MPNMNEKRNDEANSSDLCLSCGLCCKGLLFNRAVLKPDEIIMAKDVMLQYFPSGDGKFAFRLPCPLFQEERCIIYKNRFEACRRYRCDLLKRAASGELNSADSRRMVTKIRSTMTSISLRMASVEQLNTNSEPDGDFKQRIIKTLDFLCRNPMVCKDAGRLLRDTEDFLVLLHEYVDKRAD